MTEKKRKGSWLTPSFYMPLKVWEKLGVGLMNIFTYVFLILFLFPIIYMLFTSVKETEQLQARNAPIYPARQVSYLYEEKEYLVYQVPIGETYRDLALIEKGRSSSSFIDPAAPGEGLIEWEGNWRSLSGKYQFHISLDNFRSVFNVVNIPRMARNTLSIAVITEIGVLLSSLIVAYGFARYPLPGGEFLFFVMIATILIPEKITLIPSYYMYVHVLNWDESWLPILVPFFFGNAVYIFLIRQHIRSIPVELEEAAMLDGAGPLKTLFAVILPQSWPVMITVSLLHFFFIWNETKQAALYLGTSWDLAPISFGIQNYQGRIPYQNNLQASALIILVIPMLVLFLMQKFFMRDLVITGLEK